MDYLVWIVFAAVMFLGYDIYRVECQVKDLGEQVKEICSALDTRKYGTYGYEVIHQLQAIEEALKTIEQHQPRGFLSEDE